MSDNPFEREPQKRVVHARTMDEAMEICAAREAKVKRGQEELAAYNKADTERMYKQEAQEEHDALMAGVAPDKIMDIPDRVSIFDTSPYYFAQYFRLGVLLDGVEANNVAEFCQSEGWVRTLIKDGRGRWRMERGKPLTIKRTCMITVYWRKPKQKPPSAQYRDM